MPNTEQELRVMSEQAVDLLDKLIMQKELPRGTEALPRGKVVKAKGLLFMLSKKVGIAASIQHGHGFLIAKLPGVGGEDSWSAPVFVKIRSGGVGITLGVSEIKSISVVKSEAALKGLLEFQIGISADIRTALGTSDAAERPGTTFGSPAAMRDIVSYSIAQGHMVDLSLRGGCLSLDEDAARVAYGPGVDQAKALTGDLELPAPLKSLYAALDKVHADYKVELVEHAEDKRLFSGEDPKLRLF
ncbi:POC13A [Auxenochlorella protothecoides x Auxenochlorella symbiontica]